MTAEHLLEKDFVTHFCGREILPEQDPFMMSAAERLRFQVYCEECHFLPSDEYPEGRERDEHDAVSAHFGALNLDCQLTGYVRLVRSDDVHVFPFQHHCVALYDGVALPPRELSGEVSRLMVHQHYRRRLGEQGPNGVAEDAGDFARTHEKRNPSPQILLTLYRQMYGYSLSHEVRYWYAAMERSLARLLIKMGFHFQQIGPATDYYGPVAPYVGDLRLLESQLDRHNPALMAWMRGPALPC